jgi:hypothetical protein
MAEITQEWIMEQVAKGRPYTVLLLKKGPNFATTGHLQIEHLKHIFSLREAGHQLITIPITDQGELAGLALYATADKKEAIRLTAADPGVAAGRFTFEVLSCMGLPGDMVK